MNETKELRLRIGEKILACIYVLENKINHKMYVGQSINLQALKRRMRNHKGLHENRFVIDRAVNKYGWDNFKKYIYHIPENLLDYFEIEMIKGLSTLVPQGYNITPGGYLNSGMKGHKHSEETKELQRAGSLGIKRSEETKIKMRATHVGFLGGKHTEETKSKFSIDRLGEGNSQFGKTGNKAACFGRNG